MTYNNMVVVECKKAANEMRKDSIQMTYNVGVTGAHIGGALSMIEIMSALYIGVIKFDVANPIWDERDRFILSKGHGAIAQYAALKQIGLLTDKDLGTFKKNDTKLYAHPSMDLSNGIEFSSGSLGQGLSLGVGTALALKRKGNHRSRVFVLLGDGECNEGSVWEAVASASNYQLDNLTVIVDKNGLQYDGITDEILNMGNLGEKFTSFGWNVVTVYGHSIEDLLDAFSVKSNDPKVIIANTVKGKGVSFMENNPAWHNGRLTEKQYVEAMKEQDVLKDA